MIDDFEIDVGAALKSTEDRELGIPAIFYVLVEFIIIINK